MFKTIIKRVAMLLCGITLISNANAQRYFRIPFCIDIPVEIWEPKIPPIPVGCEVIDCCPGCPGNLIDWRIKVIGDPAVNVRFKIDNLPEEFLKKLQVKGEKSLIEKNFLMASRGETMISGFPRTMKGRTAVLRPELQVNADYKQKMMQADSSADMKAEKDLGQTEIVIEQRIGDYIVNEFRYVIFIRRCFWPPFPPFKTDRIKLNNNTANDQAVVLLDGRRTGDCVNDEQRRGNNLINLGQVLTNGSCRSEIVVASDDNAMELIENVTSWTNALGDLHTVNMRPMWQVPVTVWLMTGNAATLATAQADIANANLLYNTNNVGIQFNAIFNDVSANPNAGAVITNNFGCQAAEITALTGSAFFTANRLNVYYINRAFTGFNCIAVRNIVFVGTTANNQTLAHEFGHSFSLGHTNALAGFGAQNLMIGGGAGRTNITDGQAFRCNFNAGSTLNTNGVRTGPTRTCADGTTSDQCPDLSLDVQPK